MIKSEINCPGFPTFQRGKIDRMWGYKSGVGSGNSARSFQ